MAVQKQRKAVAIGNNQVLIGIFPDPIITTYAPTNGVDFGEIGQLWVDKTTNFGWLLTSETGGSSVWAPIATGAVPVVPVPGGGTGDTSFTPYAVITGGTTSTGPLQNVASVGVLGQVLTSNGASALPSFKNPTSDIWVDAAGAAQVAVANTGYIKTFAGTTTFTFPAASALGNIIEIVGWGTTGWVINIAGSFGVSGISYGGSTWTTSLSSTAFDDTARIICVDATLGFNVWAVIGGNGTLSGT